MNIIEKEKILEKWFVDQEGKVILKTLRSKNLIKDGILDSLNILTLTLFIEKKFNYKIDISKPKILKNFEKFDKIIKLLN